MIEYRCAQSSVKSKIDLTRFFPVSVLPAKGILSFTSSLKVPEGALHRVVATGNPAEASGAHNGVVLIIEQQEPQQCEEQNTNSIGQIPL